MIMYTQVWDTMQNKVSDRIVERDADHAFIPFDDANTDYQTYRNWLTAGNTPNPAIPPVVAPGSAISASAEALELSNAKALAAQGRTDEALRAVISILEKQT
jgi:DNA-binding beta-propeller fold protein YncE